MPAREWILKRNCSVTPRQMAAVFSALASVSLAVATFFALNGAWPVLVFSVLEIAVVGIAFLHFARHATDRERILLERNRLTVELTSGDSTSRVELDASRTKVVLGIAGRERIGLIDMAVRVEVGRFLGGRERLLLARELAALLPAEAQADYGR